MTVKIGNKRFKVTCLRSTKSGNETWRVETIRGRFLDCFRCHTDNMKKWKSEVARIASTA